MKNYKYLKGTLLLILILIFINGCNKQDRRISNIKAFAKLYGYVRWFHPSDEAQQIDWDKFAIYGTAKVENVPNDKALKDSLLKLFRPIAPSLKIYLDSEKSTFNISEITPPDTTAYKVIAWQHNGVELNITFNTGKSIRINRDNTESKNKLPQVVNQFLSSKLHKKNIRLKLSIKADIKDSIGIFMLPTNKLHWEFFKSIKPVYYKCETQWVQKEIKSYIQNEELVAFGVTYNGENSASIDNFELEVEEKGRWQKIEIDNLNLNRVVDNKPEGFYCFSNVNYTISSKLLDSINNNYCLEIQKKRDYQLFENYPKLGEIIDEKISEGLCIQLPLSLWGKEKQTFPKADIEILTELQQAFKGKNSKTHERLGSLVITWNIFQHFYPYFDEIIVDWEKEFEIAIRDTYNNKSEHDFLNTLRKFTANLKDGHIHIQHRSDERYCLPLAWEWIEGKLVITKVFNDTIGLEVGNIVNKIDNISAKEYFDDVQQYISAATLGYLNYSSQIKALMGKRNKECVLSISETNGKNKDIKLKHAMGIGNYYQNFNNRIEFKQLENNIIYVNLDKISMSGIESLMPQILDSKGLICDLRGYPADIRPFLSSLLKVKDTAKWICTPQIIYPDHKKIQFNNYKGWGLKPKEPHINTPVVFITDGRAISYAEGVMDFIKYNRLATIVGQTTAGTNGGINQFDLPGNYQIRFTGRKVIKSDGSWHHGVGVLPDVYVKKTIKGVRENKDEFLEKAIYILNKKIRTYNTKY